MSVADVAPHVLLIFILFLLLGGVLGAPVALAITSGASMYPSVRALDMAVLLSTRVADVKVGDLAVYRERGVMVLHRVIAETPNALVFKGDNNPAPDPLVSRDKVAYKVVAVIPGHVWAPAFSLLVVLSVVLLHRTRGSAIYAMVPLALLLAFTVLATTITQASAPYTAKPAQMPDVEIIGEEVVITLYHPVEKVVCGDCIVEDGLIVAREGERVVVLLDTPVSTVLVFN